MYYQGDYYRGDFLGLGKLARGGLDFLARSGVPVVSQAAAVGRAILGPGRSGRRPAPQLGGLALGGTSLALVPKPNGGFPQVVKGTPGAVKEPGLGGTIARILPGGQTGYELAPPGYHIAQYRTMKVEDPHIVRNRHANPANPRALRRAIRREASFINLAKRALKGSGYTFKRTGVAKKRKRSR